MKRIIRFRYSVGLPTLMLRVLGRTRWYRCRTLKMLFGRGAGYIRGATAYVAFNCVSPYNSSDGKRSMYKRRLLQIGFTRNANRVPWTSH